MSTIYSVADLAAHLGLTKNQVYRDVQSWPHNRVGVTLTFTQDQVRDIEKLLAADPAEQLERIAAMQARLEADEDEPLF